MLKIMLNTEISCQGLSSVTFVNYDTLDSTFADINVNVQFWISFINSVFDLVELLVN
jgi:hypothetical protein